MSRHIIVYSTDSGRPYLTNEILLHIVTDSTMPLESFIRKAREKYPDFYPRYAGEEVLTLNAGEGEVAIRTRADEWAGVEATDVEERGSIDHAALKELNSARLNIDYDSLNFLRFADTTYKHLLPHLGGFTVSTTVRGYHLRATLRRQLSLEEKVQLRKLIDDPERIKYDRLLAKLGYESLTDTLFHRKVFLNEEKGYEHYEEGCPVWVTELQLPDLALESEFNLPQLGRVRFHNERRGPLLTISVAEFEKPIAAEDFIKTYYAFEEAVRQAQIPIRLSRAYAKVHWRLSEIINTLAEKGKVRASKDRVEIDAGEFAGRLIGRGGQWVAQIQKELGIKLVIKGEEEHEERRMRLRKLNVLKDELLGHEGTNSPSSGAGT